MMIEFILTEAEVSGEEDSDHEIVDITDNIEDVDITEDNDFIDDRPINDEDDVHFIIKVITVIIESCLMMNMKRRKKCFTKSQTRKMLKLVRTILR